MDLIAPDGALTEDLAARLPGVRRELATSPVPLTASVGPVVGVFNAVAALDSDEEYERLVAAALRVWRR